MANFVNRYKFLGPLTLPLQSHRGHRPQKGLGPTSQARNRTCLQEWARWRRFALNSIADAICSQFAWNTRRKKGQTGLKVRFIHWPNCQLEKA